MISKHYIGWVRDSKGQVISRPVKHIANAVTTMCGGGHTGEDGIGNTTPHVTYEYI